MSTIKSFLIGSKALDQLPELKELLNNDEQDQFKLYLAKGSEIVENGTFTIFLFFFKNNKQQSAFYLKNNFPFKGNFNVTKASDYVYYTSFEDNWDLTALDSTI
ncbi:hypothetical protein [Daejeonella sp.]|jgi:hypothetical protein|uniref:hypothetical protein n=1 Tax=Daejeonella sp. TaxID=2805397 RepID=UPI003783BE42